MADIVKRLRSQADRWVSPTAFDAAIEREAADAIEELTAALRECADRFESSAELLEKSIRPNSALYMRGTANVLRALLSKYGASNG